MTDTQTAARLRALYYTMQTAERNVGGGEGIEGLYGSITRTGVQRVLECLAEKCGLNQSSHFVDVGAGLGRPLLHALIHPGVASCFGYELDKIKCMKAAAFLQKSVLDLSKKLSGLKSLPVPLVHCSSIEKVSSLEPATHAYSFWEGVPVDGKCAFGKLFSNSRTLQSVAVVQHAVKRPIEEMSSFGFGKLRLIASFPVSMAGSGRSFTAYVFQRADRPLQKSLSAQLAEDDMLPSTPCATEQRRHAVSSTELEGDIPVDVTASTPVLSCKVQTPAADESHSEAEQPVTPALPPQRNPRLAAAASVCVTPASAGISGRARRVLMSPPASQKEGARVAVSRHQAQGVKQKTQAVQPPPAVKPKSQAVLQPTVVRPKQAVQLPPAVKQESQAVQPPTEKPKSQAVQPPSVVRPKRETGQPAPAVELKSQAVQPPRAVKQKGQAVQPPAMRPKRQAVQQLLVVKKESQAVQKATKGSAQPGPVPDRKAAKSSEKAVVHKSAVQPQRRSARQAAKMLGTSTISKGKGAVQKPKSPEKATLESMGLRSKRAAAANAPKPSQPAAKPTGRRLVMEAYGLKGKGQL